MASLLILGVAIAGLIADRENFELKWIAEGYLFVMLPLVPLLARQHRRLFVAACLLVGVPFFFFGVVAPPSAIIGLLLFAAAALR